MHLFFIFYTEITLNIMKLILKNTITSKELVFEDLVSSNSKLYYKFTLNIPEGTDDGEYSYELYEKESNYDDNFGFGFDEGNYRLVSTGLCIIGDYQKNNTEYIKTNRVRKQYGK